MSKVRNKIANNRQKKQGIRQVEAFKDLKGDMQKLMEAEDYVAAMDVMAEIAANGKIDVEVMYWGAMCYFRTGDYGRAAKWINNVLTYDSSSVKGRILLSAICIADGRHEDGIKVMESVLSSVNEDVLAGSRDFVLEVLEPVRYGYDEILYKYAAVRALLENASPALSAKLPGNAKESKASSALAKLKALLEKTKAAKKNESDGQEVPAVPVIEKMELGSNGQEKAVSGDERGSSIGIHEETEKDSGNSFDVAGTMQQIMAKNISVREKIKLLNAFAAGCYQSSDYQAAFDLLDGALQLDAYAPEILQNMVYVCLSAGEKEQAVEYAAKLPLVDFGLLYALKQA